MSRSNAPGHEHAPFDDDYRGFDVREDEGARGPVILALAIGVLLIFVAVVWNTYRQGVRPEGEGLPRVIAESPEFKRVPEKPGGVVVPNADKHFYAGMDSTVREAAVPKAVEDTVLAGDAPEAGAARGPVEPVVDLVDSGAASLAAKPDPVTATADVLAADADSEAAQVPRARFAFSESGKWLVQIAALQSEEAARTAWKRVTASAPELYYGAQPNIQRADLGAEGVVYRLRVGAFADRSEATAFCDELKRASTSCFVAEK